MSKDQIASDYFFPVFHEDLTELKNLALSMRSHALTSGGYGIAL